MIKAECTCGMNPHAIYCAKNALSSYLRTEELKMSSTPSLKSWLLNEIPCTSPFCDKRGTIASGRHTRVKGEWEPEPMQCQYCYEVRFPLIDKILAKLESVMPAIMESTKDESNSDYFYGYGWNAYHQALLRVIKGEDK